MGRSEPASADEPEPIEEAEPTRQQRLVFGEVAELYDEVRPTYPDELVDVVLGFTGRPWPRTLEVGGGTGKATAVFADRGMPIHVVEPSAEMLAVARRNLSRFPLVTFEQASFEDWDPGDRRFDLLIAAQAWHWVTPRVRFERAYDALNPGGTIAVFGNQASPLPAELAADLAACYREHAPTLAAVMPGSQRRTPHPDRDDGALIDELGGLFTTPEVRGVPWATTYTSRQFGDLLATQSDHRLLPEEQRRRLLDAVASTVDSHGGIVEVPYVVELILARRLGE